MVRNRTHRTRAVLRTEKTGSVRHILCYCRLSLRLFGRTKVRIEYGRTRIPVLFGPVRCGDVEMCISLIFASICLGDIGEARWPLSHWWTDTSPLLPDAAHDSRNQGRVVSLSLLSLLLECVRLRQLREVHYSLQQALSPWSWTQSAATDGSPACWTPSLMLRVCVMLPSQSSVRSLLVLLLYKQRCLSCLARPVWGTIDRSLQRRSASDKCSVRCWPINQRDKIYRNVWSNPTFDKVHFCLFFRNLPQILPLEDFWKKEISENVLSQTRYYCKYTRYDIPGKQRINSSEFISPEYKVSIFPGQK